MILSHMEIEHIALAVTQDFTKYISHDSSETKRRIPRAIPIDQFAHDYLGLNIGFARLSPDESVCGLTCYADTEYTFEENGVVRTLPIPVDENAAKKLILTIAAAQYAAIQDDMYETVRLRRLFSAHEPMSELDATLLQASVTTILCHRDGSLDIQLKNHQRIGRSETA